MIRPSGPPPARWTKTSGVAGLGGEPLTGIFTIVSCAVLATNNAVCLLLNQRPLAPMAGGGLVGLRSGLSTQAVASPPSLPTFQMIPWCASVTYTLPTASNVNPSRPGCLPVTVMNTDEGPA